MTASPAEFAGERWVVLQLAHELRHGDVGHVQDHHAGAAVAHVVVLALWVGRPVHHGAIQHGQLLVVASHGALGGHGAGYELVGHPPTPRHYRVTRVDDVQDDVDVAPEAVTGGTQMSVASSVVEEAVDPAPSRVVPLGQELGIRRVFDIPDAQTFFVRVAPLIGVKHGQSTAKSGKHETIAHLDLGRPLPRQVRTWDKIQILRFGRVGDVHDGPTRMLEMGGVEVEPTLYLLHGHLEPGLALQIVVREDFDILCERLFTGHLTSAPLGRPGALLLNPGLWLFGIVIMPQEKLGSSYAQFRPGTPTPSGGLFPP